MAQITKSMARYHDGLVSCTYRYNDQTLAINRLEANNGAAQDLWVWIQIPGGDAFETIVPAGESASHNISSLGVSVEVYFNEELEQRVRPPFTFRSRWPA